MAISYPLTLPTVKARRITIRPRSQVGMSESPFTFAQTVYAHQGDLWQARVEVPPLGTRADAAVWISFLTKLNGREGTFLMGDPLGTTARGTWSVSSPQVAGAQAVGIKTVNIRGVDGKTWKEGDWLQFGSGLSAHLHMVVQDGSQVGSPSLAQIEIWPRTRAAIADMDPITVSSAKGIWRLASNEREWNVSLARIYGLEFDCVEAR